MAGENPALLAGCEETETATMADRLTLELEQKTAEAILETPRNQLTGWRLLDDRGLTAQEDGSVTLPLPDDFLRLYCVRLKGWARSVTETSAHDSPEALLQTHPVKGLRASAARPLAVIHPDGDGRCLRLHGAHADPPEIEEGWYMPAPRIDADGFIDTCNCRPLKP